MRFKRSLVWFRRDLRHVDHAALHEALTSSRQVYCAFIFDKDILERLPAEDRRVEFIHGCVTELDAALRAAGGALIVRHARGPDAIAQLARELQVDAVFAGRDYEPAACRRDLEAERALRADGRQLRLVKDQVLFEIDEVLSQAGKPFSVFTPYKNAWMKQLELAGHAAHAAPYDTVSHFRKLAPPPAGEGIPSLAALGFRPTNLASLQLKPGMSGADALVDDFLPRIGRYDVARDFPAVKGPSYLSTHLRFGTVSVRRLAGLALEAMRTPGNAKGAATWLSELIWREFYFMILHHSPHVAERAFKPEYDGIRWESGDVAEELFQAWCNGRTGYPLVDAAMLQLNQTGYMHNRLRMVTASFLTKDLGIDWRWGERYFAEKLNDFDLAANNGGWQWASSSGCDAQPYFRIFNPVTQSEKFDAEGKFIRRYLPMLGKLPVKKVHAPWLASGAELEAAGVSLGVDYPRPVVAHDEARERTLKRYAVVKKVREE
ncbi:cryptochrome/photolyase family protein [Noviherbaspirillum galbum]|uniref:Deoxyribodipyrimidine photo-lyase n=1 Tax=Noviherbaspirillum galbum TaxID=2709383 RepID=A0A6B3SV12_9BURK|nr:deoxyribodipyrimidine photo-lyase [Noviherbaspirillum galbum]NEX64464.1 deoxyribodipyrimidine photo-lyase [Noviherbaspirillum galbum]